MLKKCIVLNGQVINIGPWDYQYERVEVEPAEYDEEGNLVKEAVYEEIARNPLPEGAEEVEIEVCQAEDGGWVPASDYAALRRAAYPPYSVWDVLDEVLKHITPEPGSKLEQIQAERLAVKSRYPKPDEEE